jgi:hypothetical protein
MGFRKSGSKYFKKPTSKEKEAYIRIHTCSATT